MKGTETEMSTPVILIVAPEQLTQIQKANSAYAHEKKIRRSCAWCQPIQHGKYVSDVMCQRCHDRLLAEWRARHD